MEMNFRKCINIYDNNVVMYCTSLMKIVLEGTEYL